MSVDFNGSDGKLQLGPTTLTGLSYPITEFIWFLPDSASANYMVAGIGEDLGNDELMIYAEGAGTGKVKAFARDGGTNSSAASTSSIVASWECAMCVHASASSRSVYYRSGAVVTDTATVLSSLANLDRVVVGCRGKDDTLFFAGLAAHYALWSGGSALGQTEFDALAAGAVPDTVSSGTLWDYWALAASASTHTGVNGRVLTSYGGVSTGATDPPVGGGGGGATRATPFGHRGTAFNGGKTFLGTLRREAMGQACAVGDRIAAAVQREREAFGQRLLAGI